MANRIVLKVGKQFLEYLTEIKRSRRRAILENIPKTVFVLLIMFYSVANLYAAKPTEIKLSILAPEGSIWMNIMNEFNKELEKETKGQVKFKVYAGGVSGDELDVIRKIRIGQVHAGGFTGVGLGQVVSAVRVLELPFIFKSYEEVDHVTSNLKSYFEAEFDKKGFVFLGWAEAGFVNVFSTIPITTLEDFKKVKMWAWEGDPLVKALANAFKLVPVSLSITDVLTSLQTGLIDSFYAPPLGAIALQWFTKVKYMTQPPMTNATGAMIMSKKQFNKLSAENQKILKTMTTKYSEKIIQATRKDNEKSYDVLKKNGIKFVEISQKDLEELTKTSIKVREALVGKLYPKDLLDRTMKLIQEYRTKKEKSPKKLEIKKKPKT